MKVIFILGSGHCGSTLLDLLLDSHSGVFGVREMHALDAKGDLACACKATAHSCPVWRHIMARCTLPAYELEVFRSKFARILGRKVYRYVRSPQTRVDISSFIKRNEHILKILKAHTGAHVFVDSSKSPERVELLAQSSEIEPLAVHLVRDGRGGTWSYMRKYGFSCAILTKWFRENIKITLLKRRLNCPTLFFRYQDLVREPERTAATILRKAGVEGVPDTARFREYKHHQLGGNRMKWQRNAAIVEDISWHREMPALHKALFNTLFG